MDGLLLVNKPSGISSGKAVGRVIRRLGKVKGGHSGTLDPLAEGLLVIGLGCATRALGHLAAKPKCYRATARLGVSTATGDLEGAIVARRDFHMPDRECLASLFAALQGEMLQTVPAYSALKQDGKRFYELARDAQETPHRQRWVRIHRLQLLAAENDRISFDVECSKGTYIRSLAEDIGRYLNTVACLARLQRTAIGAFALEQALPLDAIEQRSQEEIAAAVLPVDQAFCDLPAAYLDATSAAAFCHGQTVAPVGAPTEERCRVYAADKQFVGVASAKDGLLKPLKVLKP